MKKGKEIRKTIVILIALTIAFALLHISAIAEERPGDPAPYVISNNEAPLTTLPETGVTSVYNIIFVIGATLAAIGLTVKFLPVLIHKKGE